MNEKRKNKRPLLVKPLLLIVLVGVIGWLIGEWFGGSGQETSQAKVGTQPVYRDIAGQIREVDPANNMITIDHEKIEGFMDSMVMDLKAAESVDLENVSAGQSVRFDLARIGDTYKVADIRPQGTKPVVSARDSAGASEPDNPLGRGDQVPNLTLYDTNGKRFQLHEMEPESKLLTFFYVRCPLETYCPAQSKRLAKLQEALEKSGSDVHLVSLTLDAGHDDPEVLADYAERFNADPSRWTLAGGEDPEAVREFAHRAGARVREYADTFQIDHALIALRLEGNRLVDRVYGLEAIAEMAQGMSP